MRFRTAPVSRTVALAAAAATAASLSVGPSYAAEPAAPRAAQQVQVKDGLQARRTVASTATRPVGVLHAAGVKVTPHDRVRLIRDGRVVRGKAKLPVRSGDVVRVIRVSREVGTRRVSIDKGRVVRTSSELKPGKRRVVSRGRDGIGKVRVVRWSRNGRPVDTDVVARRVLKAPAPRRVVVGARFGTVPGTGHLNWRALADCESSGNPRAVSPAGYAGLYQFDRGTWHSVGGSGTADQASSAEQTHRAQLLYRDRGRSPWPNCGRLL
ncbi:MULTISPECIES: resuscitation-promoting factor [unclassified Nocardioides]|uniref:resuscitation-promoting factor n=1 Tax=unclassified Nocardioides TaxID=2615069 RepID=UPI003014497C